MAGDWIKMRVALTYDLKVMQIARMLNGDIGFLEQLAPDCQIPRGGCNAQALHTFVVGALHRFWCATQEITTDGNLGALDALDIDHLVGCAGFTDALIAVGWLEILEDGRTLQVHNWAEHNGESAKKRALGRNRVEKHRSKRSDVTQEKRSSVTPMKRASVTREEKRREESKQDASASCSNVTVNGDSAEEKQRAKSGSKRARTPRDDLWDVVAELWYGGSVPTSRKAAVGKIVTDFEDLGATADDIRQRKRNGDQHWRGAVTVRALIDNWQNFAQPPDRGAGKSYSQAGSGEAPRRTQDRPGRHRRNPT